MLALKRSSVLIVDDEDIILQMLKAELDNTYKVYTACDANAAFYILDNNPVDLCISDINMPGMKGFELIQRVRTQCPKTKIALITAYNINDFIRMAKKYDISNIISKSTPFNFNEFNSIVKNLITEEIFGLEKYMLKSYTVLGNYTIKDSNQIGEVESTIIKQLNKFNNPKLFVNVLLEELITNAIYHAPVDKNGKEKYKKHSHVLLEDHEIIKLCVGHDNEKYGVSVMDTSGRLTKQQVLYRIDRHINEEGILDENGRGLHMSRIYSDRFILNIKKNIATEAIFINYTNNKYKGFKPLHINEI